MLGFFVDIFLIVVLVDLFFFMENLKVKLCIGMKLKLNIILLLRYYGMFMKEIKWGLYLFIVGILE